MSLIEVFHTCTYIVFHTCAIVVAASVSVIECKCPLFDCLLLWDCSIALNEYRDSFACTVGGHV